MKIYMNSKFLVLDFFFLILFLVHVHDKGDIFVLRHCGFLYVHFQFSLGMHVDIEVAFSYHHIICIV